MYKCLPEDEPPGSKHVEDIKKLKIKVLIFKNVHFVGLYCVIKIQCAKNKEFQRRVLLL